MVGGRLLAALTEMPTETEVVTAMALSSPVDSDFASAAMPSMSSPP